MIIIVNVIGLALIAFVVWWFWLSSTKAASAQLTDAGTQHVNIVVKGGYTPDRIVVEAGKPVQLTFNRQESDSCSEMVVFDAFGVSRKLPEGEDVTVEISPDEPGEFGFQCQMGMIHGTVVAE